MQITGVVLNIIGLAITAVAVLREGRRRSAPLLTARQAAAVGRVRRLLGRHPRVVAASGVAMGRLEVSGSGYVSSPRTADDPIEEQLRKIESNFDARVQDLESRMKAADERLGDRIDGLQEQHGDLSARVSEAEEDDRDITSQSMRWELFGIALALLGTTLSSAG